MDELSGRITRLQIERQALRQEGASREALERNRRALVAAHRDYAHALIEQHDAHRAAA